MSVLVGPIAGGLVAGGVRPYCKAASLLLIMHQVYYGFSNLIQSRFGSCQFPFRSLTDY